MKIKKQMIIILQIIKQNINEIKENKDNNEINKEINKY